MAAVDHYKDIAPKGLCSHTGSDESSYKDRIERYAMWGGAIYEAIRYTGKAPKFQPAGSENYDQQFQTEARKIVCEWLVDAGVAAKNNRKNLMSEAHREISVVCGPHNKPGSSFSVILMLAAQAESKDPNAGDLANGNPTAAAYINKNWEKFGKDILELQNKVRKDPKSFIPHLEKQSKKFQGNKLYKEDGKQFTETREGAKAYTDAVTFLRKQRPRPPFKWSEELHLACKDHVDDIAPKGLVQS